jgi:hypothetical protein
MMEILCLVMDVIHYVRLKVVVMAMQITMELIIFGELWMMKHVMMETISMVMGVVLHVCLKVVVMDLLI